MSGAMRKACRLELNNSGAWKLLGTFDAADEMQTALVLDAAEELIKTLNNGGPAKRCPTLRVSIDEPLGEVLMRWDIENGWLNCARCIGRRIEAVESVKPHNVRGNRLAP